MKTKSKKPLLEWTGYADEPEVKDYMLNLNESREEDDKIGMEEAGNMLSEDQDYWSFAWDYFIEDLSQLMKKNTYWIDNASGMGWRNRSGSKVFTAENGTDFLRAISPDTDCHYTFYKHYNGFKVRISHHDAPMGEIHIIKPLSENAYNKAVNDNN